MASEIPPGSQRKLELPLEEWLNGPERRDFGIKLQLQGPWLNYEQRRFVRIVVGIDVEALQRKAVKRQLHSLGR